MFIIKQHLSRILLCSEKIFKEYIRQFKREHIPFISIFKLKKIHKNQLISICS